MSEFAGFSDKELLDEIEREEGTLTDLEARLTELETAEAEIKQRIIRERDPRLWERRRRRAEAIYSLESDIAERSERISRFTTRIAELEAYAARPIGAVERYITRRTISRLRRTVGALRGWQTRKKRTLRSLKGWQTRELALEPRLKELYTTLAYWTQQITLLTATIKTEQDRLERKKEELRKREEEWIADEECSGYDIYYQKKTKKYVIRDPNTKELIRTEQKICMEITASIKTRIGHDVPVIVEITCTTYVKEMGLSHLIAAERKVNEGLYKWLIEQAWGALIHAFEKIGSAYNGENHVREKVWYTWQVPDYPKVHVIVEKKKPRPRSYHGDFEVE